MGKRNYENKNQDCLIYLAIRCVTDGINSNRQRAEDGLWKDNYADKGGG